MKILKRKKYSLMSIILKYSFVILFGLAIVSHSALAVCLDGSNSNPCPTAGSDNTGGNTAGSDNTGTNITTGIVNPLGEDGPDDIPAFIRLIVKAVLYVGVPIVALAIIYTGFLFVEAQGNPEKITKAKKALTYTLIGAALLLGAFVVAEAIQATVEEITSTT